MTGALGLFQKDPTFKTLQNVKDPWYQSFLTGAGGDLNAARGTQQTALRDYISKYLSGEGAAQQRTAQQIGNIDRYWDGSVQRDLAGQRAAWGRGLDDSANLAMRYGIAAGKNNSVTNEGGANSRDQRVLLRTLGDIQTQKALEMANRASGDYRWLEGARFALPDRNAMAAAQAGYGLVPENVRMQMLTGTTNLGNTIGNGLLNNSIWGVSQNQDFLDKLIVGMDKDMATATNLIAAVRGGSPSASGPAPTTTWGSPTANQSAAFSQGFGPVSTGFANQQQGQFDSFVNSNPYSYPAPSGNPYSPAPVSYSGGGWGSWPTSSGSDAGMGGWAY